MQQLDQVKEKPVPLNMGEVVNVLLSELHGFLLFILETNEIIFSVYYVYVSIGSEICFLVACFCIQFGDWTKRLLLSELSPG